MTTLTATESLIRRDRGITLAALAVLTLLSWVYVLDGAGTGMSTIAMTTWQFPPPAAPAMEMAWSVHLLDHHACDVVGDDDRDDDAECCTDGSAVRRARCGGRRTAAGWHRVRSLVAIFVAGYLTVWLGFSAVATVAQWALEQLGLMHAMLMWSTNTTVVGRADGCGGPVSADTG